MQCLNLWGEQLAGKEGHCTGFFYMRKNVFNLRSWKVEAVRSLCAQGQPGLHREALSRTNEKQEEDVAKIKILNSFVKTLERGRCSTLCSCKVIASGSFNCYYKYVHVFIPKYINTTCSVCFCMCIFFSTAYLVLENQLVCSSLVEEYFALIQHSLFTWSSLFWVGTTLDFAFLP